MIFGHFARFQSCTGHSARPEWGLQFGKGHSARLEWGVQDCKGDPSRAGWGLLVCKGHPGRSGWGFPVAVGEEFTAEARRTRTNAEEALGFERGFFKITRISVASPTFLGAIPSESGSGVVVAIGIKKSVEIFPNPWRQLDSSQGSGMRGRRNRAREGRSGNARFPI